MNETICKAIFSPRGNVLGEVFETNTGFGFHHVDTNTLQTGFADFESAMDAWHCFHHDWFENLPR
jgi:hypothetical protein